MLNKLRNRKGFTLVELMIVVAIIGILAAIAIPAFLRSVKKSKTAEAEGTMRKMADGAKGYFTSEQKDEPAQPWHSGTATAPGYPVEWNDYVFPGGDGQSFNTSGGWGKVVEVATSPTGGSKQPANPCGADTATCPQTLNKLGVDFKDPLYFQYAYVHNANTGETAGVTITATANFNTGNAIAHTVQQEVRVDATTQEVLVTPPFTSNEFE